MHGEEYLNADIRTTGEQTVWGAYLGQEAGERQPMQLRREWWLVRRRCSHWGRRQPFRTDAQKGRLTARKRTND